MHTLLISVAQPGRGFVFVDNPEQYGLPPGQQTDDGPIYSVSLFHQLHCLGQIREAHWVLLHSVEVGRTRKAAALLGPHGDHVKHCLDYLRQSLMCNGDMTLEAPLQDGAGAGFAVDGWGKSRVGTSNAPAANTLVQASLTNAKAG